jgi:hypothetical protein
VSPFNKIFGDSLDGLNIFFHCLQLENWFLYVAPEFPPRLSMSVEETISSIDNCIVLNSHSDNSGQFPKKIFSHYTLVPNQTRHGRSERRWSFLPVYLLNFVGVVNKQ